MPRATIDLSTIKHYDLNTCPGGFVELRHMSYGEKLQRQQLALKMQMTSGKGKDFEGEMQLANAEVTQFEFSKCIVDHNLEDESGRKLNLTNVLDINKLHPQIGEEIDTYISEMNNYEVEQGNSSTGSEQA